MKKTQVNNHHSIARSSSILTVFAILSPIAGIVLEMVMAWRFGSTGVVDAYRIASLILAIGSQLFISQMLPHIVIPLFSEYRAKNSDQEGWRLAFTLATLFSATSMAFTFFIWIYPNKLVDFLGPGLVGSSREDALTLVRYFGLAFIINVWSGVISGILYCYRVFWLPPVTQLLFNLLLILAIVFLGTSMGSGSLALGILLGSLAMFGLHLYALNQVAKESGIHFFSCLKLGLWDGVSRALYLAIPLIVMIFVGQWGIIVINRCLSEMPLGSLANFGYAWKMLLIVGLLPASLATVIFPAFSDAQARNNHAEFSRLATRAIKMTLFLTLPLASVLFVEQLPLISFMFERGAMSNRDVVETAQLFGLLLIGAPASALWVVLNKVAFAMMDKKSPLVITIAIAIGITLLVPYAAKTYGANGIALMLSAMPLAGTLSLLSFQIYKFGIVHTSGIVLYFSKLAVLCIGVALPVLLIRYFFHVKGEVGITLLVTEIVTVNLVAIASVFWLSRLLGISEMDELRRFMLNQLCKLTCIKRFS